MFSSLECRQLVLGCREYRGVDGFVQQSKWKGQLYPVLTFPYLNKKISRIRGFIHLRNVNPADARSFERISAELNPNRSISKQHSNLREMRTVITMLISIPRKWLRALGRNANKAVQNHCTAVPLFISIMSLTVSYYLQDFDLVPVLTLSARAAINPPRPTPPCTFPLLCYLQTQSSSHLLLLVHRSQSPRLLAPGQSTAESQTRQRKLMPIA